MPDDTNASLLAPTDFSTLFESLDSPHIILRLDGTLIAANESFKSLFERAAAFAQHANVLDLISSNQDGLLRKLELAAGLSTPIPMRLDLPGSIKPGRRQAVARRLHLTNNQTAVLVRLRRQQENTDVFAKLNGRLDVLRKRLGAEARERKLLEETNEDLAQFAGVAAHDLRSPLGQMRMMAQLIKMDDTSALSDHQNELLDDIETASSRMSSLVSALLRHAQSANAELESTPVALSTVVERVTQNIQSDINDAGASVNIEALPTIECDEALVTQIFQNLISNSIKYRHPDRSPESQITHELQGDTCRIMVSDNGRGFDGADTAQLFEAFSRLRNARDQEGAGIGLATCAKIAARHGWKMSATDSSGEGAEFSIEIPSRHLKDT